MGLRGGGTIYLYEGNPLYLHYQCLGRGPRDNKVVAGAVFQTGAMAKELFGVPT